MPDPDKVYDVLVREAGADPARRDEFAASCSEWLRFYAPRPWGAQAVTWFPTIPGTRMALDPRRGCRVSMYVKDDREVAARTNAALAALESEDARP